MKGGEWLDLSLTSADNPNTPILAERMGAKVYKRYRVYRRWVWRTRKVRKIEGGCCNAR